MITATDIRKSLERHVYGYHLKEFVFGGLRVDVAVVDPRKRKVRGFEIKINRNDFLQDKKWQLYSRFCSSLAIVCPAGLIQPKEVTSPFGLLWIGDKKIPYWWRKKAKNIQSRESLAWMWRYLEILETVLKHKMFEKYLHSDEGFPKEIED